ncbi:MAG: SDR family oxidoreductase [Candidatus Limnocylindrales bacterium]
MSGLLDGKRALVFACGDGIGEAVATRFREEGGQTLVASEQGELAHGGTPAGVASVFEAANAQLGGIDTVVNAVTRWWVGFPEDATDEVIADLFRWNVATASAVAQGALRHIPGSGSLLSISHVWATGTSPELGVAGASKAALGPLTKAVAQRGAARRFRANLLLVGVVDTPSQKPWTEFTPEEWDRNLAIDLKGMFICARAVYPTMQQQQSGRIVNISSGTMMIGMPNFLPYVSAKAGVIGFTRSLATEVGGDNITVNAVIVGLYPHEIAGLDNMEAMTEMVKGMQALKRIGQPDDLSPAVVFLASDDARWITGQAIAVDGGLVRSGG